MIKKFDTFNEAKLVKGNLLEDVKNAFAYLVDENPIIKITEPKAGQVSVFIPAIISPSRKYTIEEYADVQNRWNEIVQDTWVAAQQITDKGDISVDTYTIVGSQGDTMLRLTFFSTENTDVFKINAKTVYVSKVNLLRACKFPSCDFSIMNTANQAVLKFVFDQQQSIDEKTELLDNLRYITNKYGLSFTTGTIGTGFYLSIYFEIPIPNLMKSRGSIRVPVNKKFILKDLV
jgi:hypothetical protein